MKHIILLLIFTGGVFINLKGQDTSDREHVSIIKNLKKIALPNILDENFCLKLHAINIPDSVSFIDEGRPKYYYLNFEITFTKSGKILAIKPGGTISGIGSIVCQVKQLLLSTHWNVITNKKKLSVNFIANLEDRKFKDVAITRIDNLQREKICK